jgi:hypothetical protein
VSSLALSLRCCCSCRTRLPAPTEPFAAPRISCSGTAACNTAFVARRRLFGRVGWLRLRHGQHLPRSALPTAASPARQQNAMRADRWVTIPPPPISPPPNSATCPASRALVSPPPLPLRGLFWLVCALVFVPPRIPAKRSALGLAPACCKFRLARDHRQGRLLLAAAGAGAAEVLVVVAAPAGGEACNHNSLLASADWLDLVVPPAGVFVVEHVAGGHRLLH